MSGKFLLFGLILLVLLLPQQVSAQKKCSDFLQTIRFTSSINEQRLRVLLDLSDKIQTFEASPYQAENSNVDRPLDFFSVKLPTSKLKILEAKILYRKLPFNALRFYFLHRFHNLLQDKRERPIELTRLARASLDEMLNTQNLPWNAGNIFQELLKNGSKRDYFKFLELTKLPNLGPWQKHFIAEILQLAEARYPKMAYSHLETAYDTSDIGEVFRVFLKQLYASPQTSPFRALQIYAYIFDHMSYILDRDFATLIRVTTEENLEEVGLDLITIYKNSGRNLKNLILPSYLQIRLEETVRKQLKFRLPEDLDQLRGAMNFIEVVGRKEHFSLLQEELQHYLPETKEFRMVLNTMENLTHVLIEKQGSETH